MKREDTEQLERQPYQLPPAKDRAKLTQDAPDMAAGLLKVLFVLPLVMAILGGIAYIVW